MPQPLAERIDTIGTKLQDLVHRAQSEGAPRVMRQPGDLYEAIGAVHSLTIKLGGLVAILADRARQLAKDDDLYSTTSGADPQRVLTVAEAYLRTASHPSLTALNDAHELVGTVGRNI